MILAQCQPIQVFWVPNIWGSCGVTPMLFLYATAVPHLLLEIAILVCPLVEIRRLHMARQRKIAVAALFMSGLLVCGSAVGSIAHTLMLREQHKREKNDYTWDGLEDQVWAVCDVNLASFASQYTLIFPLSLIPRPTP